MKERVKTKWLLFGVVLVGFFLRFWQLGNIPPSLNWDEVALGYNAYSIYTTGKDEYGTFLPLILRSYDDYKPALYAYLAIPSVAIFGLTPLAVRLPAAVFGTMAVVATYFLVRELFGKRKSRIAVLSSFLLAISPWHLQFSRIGFESGVGVAFNIFAALFFLKGLRKPIYLSLAAFCFGVAPSIYQSDKVFTPLLFLLAVILYFKDISALPKKHLILASLVWLITIFPVAYYHLTDPASFSRASGVSVFADQTTFLKGSAERLSIDQNRGDIIGLVFDNRRVEFAKAVIAGYLSHFDLNWLFVHGDLPRHHAPFMGLLYLWELPFLFIGIYQLVFGGYSKRVKLLIFGWFLIAPIPASVTSGVPHAVRTLNFLPTFQIFVALGLLASLVLLSNIKRQIAKLQIKYLLFTIFFSFFVFNFLYYLNQYFLQQNYYTSSEWQYGYEEAVNYVSENADMYDRIVVANRPPLDQSYMFFLFYLKYPPEKYQKFSSDASGGFAENHAFEKFEFRPIEWEKETKDKTLFVGRPDDFPENVQPEKTIYYLNGEEAIKIVAG